VSEALDAEGIDRTILVGHSMGGDPVGLDRLAGA